MAAVTNLGLLLIVFICGIHGEENFYDIKIKGEVYTFPPDKKADFCVISRSIDEENLVLWNTSDPSPENPTLPEDLKKRLELSNEKNISSYKIHNLTHSDSGLYREECWTDGHVTYQWSTSITVCSTETFSELWFRAQRTMDIPCKKESVPVGDNLTVQWFRTDFDSGYWTRMFTDDGSLNPLMKHLERSVQLVENSSSLRIPNFARKESRLHTCLVMEKQQCVSSNLKYLDKQFKYIVHSVGEGIVLPCFDTDLYGPPIRWWKSGKSFSVPPSQNHSEGFGNLTDREQQYRYSDNPVVNDNFSLVFSSLMLNHTDIYECVSDEYVVSYLLQVCPESAALTQFFSDGEEVTLSCDSSKTTFGMSLWVRKTEQEKNVLLYPTDVNVIIQENTELYEGLKDRLNVSSHGKTIVLSNLSPEDSGEYWCVVNIVGRVCNSTARTILIYKNPSGIDSTFYAVWASLMSCGLLGMVCAVILTTRRGEQVPVI